MKTTTNKNKKKNHTPTVIPLPMVNTHLAFIYNIRIAFREYVGSKIESHSYLDLIQCSQDIPIGQTNERKKQTNKQTTNALDTAKKDICIVDEIS